MPCGAHNECAVSIIEAGHNSHDAGWVLSLSLREVFNRIANPDFHDSSFSKLVEHPRLELGTSGLKVRCATNCANAPWSGKRDLNPRLQPWQGCTLPLSYSRKEVENGERTAATAHKNFPILTNLDESEGFLFKKKRKKVKKMRNPMISSTYKPRPKTTF